MHAELVNECKQVFTPPFPLPRKQPAPNFIWLRSLAALPKILTNPIASFSEDAFEETVTFTQIFNQPVALLHDPGFIRHVFIDKSELLSADPVRQAVLKPALREGMLTAEGQQWRKARRTIAPVFAPRHVNGFAQAMQRVTQSYINELSAVTGTVSIAEHMTRLTYLILSETLFSGDIDERGDQLLADVAYFLKHLSQPDPLDLLNAPQWLPRITKLRGTKALKSLRKSVRETAQQRKTQINEDGNVPDDFLTLLLRAGETAEDQLSIDEVEDNIITFIAAGHETTARALAWTLYLLSFDEDARTRCENEADALDMENIAPHEWSKHLPWITACFEETMRLFPPAGIIARRLDGEIEHEGKRITEGSIVFVAPWVLHRHKQLWEKPNAFHPERFFGDKRKKIDRFTYLPFGLGQRVCIGASFAMQEALIILAMLLREFRFEYAGDKKPMPVMRVTIQPDNGVPMRVFSRGHNGERVQLSGNAG